MRIAGVLGMLVFVSIACSREREGDERVLVASRVSGIAFVGVVPVESAAVLATNSAEVGERAVVAGRVVVSAGTPGAFGQVLADGVRLSVGDFADLGATSGSESFAYSVIFRYGADVDRAYVHEAVLDEHDDGLVAINSFPLMPRKPRARAVFAGTEPLSVAASSTVTVSTSTSWSSIEVGARGVLYLQPGNYELEHMSLGDGARLSALGPVELRVAERISAGRGVRIEATTARELRIEVLGENGGAHLPGSVPRALEIGDASEVHAILFAPNGTLRLGAGATLLGAAVGRDVLIDDRARVTYQDGLLPIPATAPLVYEDLFAATEDEVLHVGPEGVLANDLDPTTYAELTAELVTETQSGTISLSSDGGFTYTPNANFAGDDTFIYRAHSPAGTSTTTTVTIRVDGTNDIPVISSHAPQTSFIGATWRYAVSCADRDLGDILTYTASAGLTVNGNLITWTPSIAGTYNFEIRCADQTGAFDEQHVRVTVSATVPIDQLIAYAQSSLIFRGTAIDGSVGALGSTMIEQGASTQDVFGASVALRPLSSVGDVYTNNLIEDQNIARGIVAALPNMPALPAISAVTPGSTPLLVTTDQTLSSTISTASIEVQADTCLYLRPGIHHTGDVTIGAGGCLVALGPVELRIAGRLQLSDRAYIGPDAATMRIEVHAQQFAVETKNQSALAATVIAPNGAALFGWHSVNWGAFYARDIFVAEGALFFGDGATTAENEPPRIVSTPIASISEGATFTYAVQVADTPEDTHTITLELAPSTLSLADNTLTWTPQNADVGAHTIRIRATDSAGLSDTQTFTLTVINVNNAPTFMSAPHATANEDELYTAVITAQDPDGDPVSISLLQGPQGMALTVAEMLTWTPGQDDIGAHNIVLAATDGALSTTQTFQIIVQAINDPPTFDGTPPTNAIEDQHYSFTLQATDPDPSDILAFALLTAPAGMTLTGALLEWTPTNEDVGAHTVAIEVRDLAGATANTSFTLTVTNENDPPELINTPPTAATENALLTFTIEARDPDPSDTVTYALDLAPEGMTLTGATASWTPSDDQVGTFSVTIRATDPHGATALQSFAIEVDNVNDAPAFESTPITNAFEGQLYRYLARAHDIDARDTLTYTVDGPSGLSITGSELTWTPGQSQVGSHTVTLTVRDAAGAGATQSFTIIVGNIDDPPIFANTAPPTARQHELYTFTALVLDDSPQLAFTFDTAPLGMNIDSTGVLTWTPSETQSGDYTVVLRVTDEQGFYDLLSFTVVVLDVNDAPSFVTTPATAAIENTRYTYAARATDLENDPIAYVAITRPAALSVDAITGVVTWVPNARDLGTHPVTLRATDQRGAHTDQSFTITVARAPCGPGNTSSRCSALAWTHTVRSDGMPLATTIEQQGPDGVTALISEGFATLGGGPTGNYRWTFSAPGHVSVHATATLAEQEITHVPIPRMAPLADLTGEIDLDGTSFEDVDGRVELIFLPGSVAAPTNMRAAILDGNSLPAYLPRGYSPLAAIAYEVDVTPAQPPRAQFRSPANTTLLLATLDETTREWIALEEIPSSIGEVTLGAPATYALLIRDEGPGAPAAFTPNAPLASSALPSPVSQLEASGAVVPEWQITSENIDEITGIATITLTTEDPIASGLVLPARLFETYTAADQLIEAPYLDLGVAFYRRDPSSNVLIATFPVRPRNIIELNDTHQRIEVTEELHFDGAALDANGGSISTGNITLTGAFSNPTLVALTEVERPNAVLAFRSTWSTHNNTRLHLEARAEPNSNYVLAREELGYGWTPVERLHTNTAGDLLSSETELPGITISGTYALFAAPIIEGVVRGLVVQSTSVAGAIVTIGGRPWIYRTDDSGTFALLGYPGAIEARAERRSDNGIATGTLETILELTITLGAQPPRILRTEPANNAPATSVITAIDVHFSEPVLASSVLANAIQVANAVGTTTLRPDHRTLIFLPNRPLDNNTIYEVQVDPNITDVDHHPLDGDTTFTFTTELTRARLTSGARLISYAPGSQNTPCGPSADPTITCVTGTAGTADPNVPVILINEETGAATTVLSQPDGSFQSQIRGRTDDLLSAILVNQNGTRTIVPLEMQRFDDGRVALYASGGIVEGDNPFGGAPFELVVEPGTIPRRGVFTLLGRYAAHVQEISDDTPPAEGEILFGATVTYDGDAMTAPIDVRFPVDFEADPAAGYLLTRVRRVRIDGEDVVTYEVLDRMQHENGALVTHSFPMLGLIFSFSVAAAQEIAINRSLAIPTAMTGLVVSCPFTNEGSECNTLYSPPTEATPNVFDPSLVPPQARRLPGSVVYAVRVAAGEQLSPTAGGTLNGGELVSVANNDGRYAIAVPLIPSTNYVVRAAHPDLPGSRATSAPVHIDNDTRHSFVNLVFNTAEDASSEQLLSAALTHAPQHPDVFVPAAANDTPDTNERAELVLRFSPAWAIHDLEIVPSSTTATISAPQLSQGRATYLLTSIREQSVRVRAVVTANGRSMSITHAVAFGGTTTELAPDDPAPIEPNDTTGPQVVNTWPSAHGFLSPGTPIVIQFNEPISRSVLSNAAAIFVDGPSAVTPELELDADQRRLELTFPALTTNATYSITLSSAIIDLSRNELDQDPLTPNQQDFILPFRTGGSETHNALAEIGLGGGAVVHGRYAYVLDRTGGTLHAYDLVDPNHPVHLPHVEVLEGGYPRDLVIVPNYSFVRPIGAPSQPACGHFYWETPHNFGCASLDRTLLVIVGGIAGFTLDGFQPLGQRLHIFDITEGPNALTKIATSLVTQDPNATLGRLIWSPPDLAYLRRSNGPTVVEAINLQEHLFARALTTAQLNAMPSESRTPGFDENEDGDYVDENELLPLPPRPFNNTIGLNFAGLELSLGAFDTTQQMIDYAFYGKTRFVGSLLGPGVLAANSSSMVEDAYRTLFFSDVVLPRSIASFDEFPPSAELEALAYFPQQAIAPLPGPRDLAIVGTFDGTQSRLYILDVTDVIPALIDQLVLPRSSGRVQKIDRDPLIHGILRISTANDIVLVDLDRRAVIGTIAGVGSSHNANGDTAFGVHVLSDTKRVAFTGPQLFFVSFPNERALVSPAAWPIDERARRRTIDTIFDGVEIERDLRLARKPIDAGEHFYVLMYAPGASGANVELQLESLNDAGYPLFDHGRGFAPVRAARSAPRRAPGLPITGSFTASRLSDDPASMYFNVYLSRPFALIAEKVEPGELPDAIHSGDAVRVSLDPSETSNAVLGSFASSSSSDRRSVGTAIIASAFPARRILGPNPPPIAGAMRAPGTDGMIALPNGELRFETIDLALPSPQLPFAFTRVYTGQDYVDGAFGPGFDFNYNQKLVELAPANVPEDLPLARPDTIASPRDVLLHTGLGAVIVFHRIEGAAIDAHYGTDPLLDEFRDNVVDWYQPETGVFDALMRVEGGGFIRATPSGVLYFYEASGRLHRVFHRYRKNNQQLYYGARGELRRIEDRSTGEQRFFELRYFGFEDPTPNEAHVGRVSHLVDHLGRRVSFEYDREGRLEIVRGVEVGGRRTIEYGWHGRFMNLVREGTSQALTTISTSTTSIDPDGRIHETTGLRGTTRFTFSPQSATTILADGVQVVAGFDRFGLAENVVYRKTGAADEETSYAYAERYLAREVRLPRRNTIRFDFDLMNPHLRGRANVTATTHAASTGAEIRSQTPTYDPLYNLPVFRHFDAEGRSITFALTADRADIASIARDGGIIERFGYDAESGQLLRHDRADGTIASRRYDPSNGFVIVESAGSIATTFNYDTCAIGGRLGRPCSARIASGEEEIFGYNALGEETFYRKGGFERSTSRDLNGFISQIEADVGAGRPYIETRTYDSSGFMRRREQRSVETNGSTPTLTWEYRPDPLMRVAAEVRPDGKIHEYTYDLRGRVASAGIGSQVTSYIYDLNGNLTDVFAGSVLLEHHTYDGFDRVERIDRAGGGETTLEYRDSGAVSSMELRDQYGTLRRYELSAHDALNRPTSWTENGVALSASFAALTSTISGPRGLTHVAQWDAAGLTTSDRVLGLYERTPVWNTSGRLTRVAQIEGTFGANYGAELQYSADGFLSRVLDARGGARVSITTRADGVPVSVIESPDRLHLTTAITRSILGEDLGTTNAEGVSTATHLDELGRTSREGPALLRGRSYHYDSSDRLDRVEHADNNTEVFGDHDALGNPRRISIGGDFSVLATRDELGRPRSRTVTFEGRSFTDRFAYDALDRVRTSTFAFGGVDFEYDLLGVRRRTNVRFDGVHYPVVVEPDAIGAPRSTSYPSGARVHQTRSAAGRLESSIANGSPLTSVTSYAMATAPAAMTIGGAIERRDVFDHRRRLLARSYTTNGRAIAELRYEFDDADRETSRQYLHEGGRADVFDYDSASRLTVADFGARPRVVGESSPDRWIAAESGRRYSYDQQGADRVELVTTSSGGVVLAMRGFDDSGFARYVGSSTRAIDLLGSVTQLSLPTGEATLEYDGLSRLTRLVRADGSIITYDYRSDGPLVRRTVACSPGALGCVDSNRIYVYDDLRLLEEYEVTPSAQTLVSVYYYADEAEIPIGADFHDPQTGDMERHYFVVDRVGSIHGVLDEVGNWVERVHYDAWGRPTIEPADTTAPELSEIAIDPTGGILVVFTEEVLPPPVAASGPAATSTLTSLENAIELHQDGVPILATIELEENNPTYRRGTVLRVTPLQSLPFGTQLDLTLMPDRLIDRWSNANGSTALRIVYAAGLAFIGPPQSSKPTRERSQVGNSILFQSHLYDYDADLIHMRARMFDPTTGTFLQRDPFGYEDSVNLYAGLANDPINNRDPTGKCVWESDAQKRDQCWSRARDHLSRAETTADPDPRKCEDVVQAIVDNRLGRLRPEDYDCVYAVYSAKEGVTITDENEKVRGVNLDQDPLHRRVVRLFARAELRVVQWPNRPPYDQQRAFLEAITVNGLNRRRLKLTESLLGRDVNRYFYGRLTPWFRTINERYEAKKRKDTRGVQLTAEPASALGGTYFLEKGIEHGLKCAYRRIIPLFDSSDAQLEPSHDPESDDFAMSVLCGDDDAYWVRDFPPHDVVAGIERSY